MCERCIESPVLKLFMYRVSIFIFLSKEWILVVTSKFPLIDQFSLLWSKLLCLLSFPFLVDGYTYPRVYKIYDGKEAKEVSGTLEQQNTMPREF